MNLRATALNIGILVGVFVLGGVAGAAAWSHYRTSEPEEVGTVVRDTSPMGWDELVSSLPNQTTVRGEDSTTTECLEVPIPVVRPERPPPDTVYRTRHTDLAGLEEHELTFGQDTGLIRRAESRYPFLYLPLLEDGTPAIEHTGTRTTVRAWDERRGYAFTYRYQPARFTLWGETYGTAAWSPPTTPTDVAVTGGMRLGATIRRDRGLIEPSIGAAVTPIGVAGTVSLGVRGVLFRLR